MTKHTEIIAAIQSVRAKITPMGTDAANPHGGYNYISIDKYYTHVAKAINEAGLVWRTKEVGYELIPNQGKERNRTYVKVQLQYDLYKGDECIEDYSRVTVLTPVDGPQTTGQVFSYAEKVFMRVLACVPTGEKDADDTKQEPIHTPDPLDLGAPTPASPPKLRVVEPPPAHDADTGELVDGDLLSDDEKVIAPKFKEGLPVCDTRRIDSEKAAATLEAIFKAFVPTVGTTAKLADFHAENLAAIEKVKGLDPNTHTRIKQLFNDRNKELKARK